MSIRLSLFVAFAISAALMSTIVAVRAQALPGFVPMALSGDPTPPASGTSGRIASFIVRGLP